MDKERKHLEELFQKYSQGLITDEEKQLLARWLVYLDVDQELTAAQIQAKEDLSSQSLKAHFFAEPSSPKVFKLASWSKRIAAVLFVLFSIAAIFYLNKANQQETQEQLVYKKVTTGVGQMKVLTLTDGTEITINNQSSVSYPVSFTGASREIFLSGEAFFKVAHNPAKPFKVHTSKMDVQVLGTSFDVKAYADDRDIVVSVMTGKVRAAAKNAKSNKASHILLPGDQLVYRHELGEFEKGSVALTVISGWQKGKLSFKNQQLADITRQLERYYKVKFLFVNKEIQHKVLSINVNNQSLEVVMKALSLSGEFNYRIAGNQVKIW